MDKNQSQTQLHNIQPVYNNNSKILILGSFPSVLSRESFFFYGHPQNRFWKVLSAVFNGQTPVNIDDKRNFLLAHNIAVWDVIEKCDIIGSSDSSIKNVVANNLDIILNTADINAIYANGKTSEKLYNKYIYPHTKRPIICLPSTSPANATFTLPRLINAWKIIAY